ncbi:helix-turn-helix transcriptional regulator [Trueperella bialowiezensis]|uniref:WYL domain-containing protein n=1 Tax=Trueperella bialowiezensis TaxID=312285 RepID=A0A448PC71_9ACTO|nr:WYL domain-containing protein [Trueperella bialowiezensis]VEI12432.1 Uncharacterised protein [Trueperella bialowiezensis]
MTHESRTASERRFALLVCIRSMKPTIDDMMALPVYHDYAEGNRRRYVERDVQRLRHNGYPVVVDDRGRYVLDQSTNIHVDASGVELGILSSLLQAKGTTTPFVQAQHGITKLLSRGQVAQKSAHLTVHTPAGEEAVRIAAAIQMGKRISCQYTPASSATPKTYVIEPFRLEAHFDVFYLRGYQVSVNGEPRTGQRTYKLDRIDGEVEILDSDITYEFDDSADSDLAPINATVRLHRELPLIAQASSVNRHDGVIDIELTNIDRGDLYADLMFYGLDAELLGPADVRADFHRRVEHVAQLGEGGND